jgi:hypothetical protein
VGPSSKSRPAGRNMATHWEIHADGNELSKRFIASHELLYVSAFGREIVLPSVSSVTSDRLRWSSLSRERVRVFNADPYSGVAWYLDKPGPSAVRANSTCSLAVTV